MLTCIALYYEVECNAPFFIQIGSYAMFSCKIYEFFVFEPYFEKFYRIPQQQNKVLRN